jgi:5-methylcytosine-specific restriction enzyme B
MLEPVDQILIRKVTPSNFYDIERTPSQNGGTGPHRIEMRPAHDADTIAFFGLKSNFTTQDIDVRVIGDPATSAPMRWGRRPRMNTPQARQRGERHPAWAPERGFPAAPDTVGDKDEAEQYLPAGLRIYMVRTSAGEYYAGFIAATSYPAAWPDDAGLRGVWANDGIASVAASGTATDLHTERLIQRVLDAWDRGRGALLYGPPGTSKTHVMGVLRERLESGAWPGGLFLDPADAQRPFHSLPGVAPLPSPITVDWVTFHQSYSYEEFVLGLRPRPASGGTELRPRLGRLLDRLHDVWDSQHPARAAAFFIDEVNRGNAARIFGELITFLDVDYRDGGQLALPVPLPGLDIDPGSSPTVTEELDRPSGGTTRLPVPWLFPRHAYFLATMNSVDRAAIPIDSALARRFERVELRPDLDLLAEWVGVAADELRQAAETVRGESAAEDAWTSLTAEQCAVLLLDRLNHIIADDFGEDFELGHALLRPMIGAPDGWSELARLWDEVLWPQVQERYVGRPDQMQALLKVGTALPGVRYAFRPRAPIGSSEASMYRAAEVRLSALPRDELIATLQYLCC